MSLKKVLLWSISAISLLVMAFLVVPTCIEKISAKLFKRSLIEEEIDFDNLGPEIVKTEIVEDKEND